jgi:hypothetical protein
MGKRNEREREYDLAFIAPLYCRNMPQTKILEELIREHTRTGRESIGISLPTLSDDIELIQKRWINSSLVSFNELKARELAKIDALERAYWDGYERAMQTKAETETTEESEDSEKPYTKKTRREKREEDLLSGKYWLDGVEKCIVNRCKVLGLFEPDKFQVDWRTEAIASGMKPESIDASFEKMIQAAYAELQSSPKLAEPQERIEQ